MSNSNTAPAFSADPTFDAGMLDYIASVLPGIREHIAYLESIAAQDTGLAVVARVARLRQDVVGGEAILARHGR